MGVWLGQILFRDVKKTSTLQFSFPNAAGVFDGAEFAAVKTLIDDLRVQFEGMSEASVGSRVIFEQEPAVAPETLSKTISVYDKMTIVAFTDEVDATGAFKTYKFDIPAPSGAIFEGTSRPDLSGAEFTALSADLEAARIFGWRVSDGEQFDISRGVNGFSEGKWTTRKGSRG